MDEEVPWRDPVKPSGAEIGVMLNESKRKVWHPELAWDSRMKRYPTGEKFNE